MVIWTELVAPETAPQIVSVSASVLPSATLRIFPTAFGLVQGTGFGATAWTVVLVGIESTQLPSA